MEIQIKSKQIEELNDTITVTTKNKSIQKAKQCFLQNVTNVNKWNGSGMAK